MEGYQRHVLFDTKDSNKYQCVGKLDDYEDTLTPYGFIRCHKGYLVNLNYVKAIENTKVVTIYNHMLDMSTRKKQACLRAFNKFIAKYRM
jgi:DNA-binding LytR/AlgR family response regulator